MSTGDAPFAATAWTDVVRDAVVGARRREELAVSVPRIDELLVRPDERVHFLAFSTVERGPDRQTVTFTVVVKNETERDLHQCMVIPRRLTDGRMDDVHFDAPLQLIEGGLDHMSAMTGYAVLRAALHLHAGHSSQGGEIVASFAFVARDDEGRFYRDENDAVVSLTRRPPSATWK